MPVTQAPPTRRRPSDGSETVEEHIQPQDDAADETERIDKAAQRIRLRYKGCRVTVTGIPSRRCVNDNQRADAARLFDADQGSVSMSTLLWNANEPAVKELRSVINSVQRTFHDRTLTLPTVQPGLRMLRKDAVSEFNRRMHNYRTELVAKAELLEQALPEIIARERDRRGTLFNRGDYDFKPTETVSLRWHFPVVVEDQDMAHIDDTVYQEEVARVQNEMRAIVKQTEDQMAESFYQMLDYMAYRLGSMDEEGKPKTFKDATVNKVFEELDHMSQQLQDNGLGGDALLKAAQRVRTVLRGQSADTLPGAVRKNDSFREHVRTKCQEIADSVLKTAVPEQRRQILRKQASKLRKE